MSDHDTSSAQAPQVDEHLQPILTHEKSLTAKIAKGSEAGDIVDQQMIMLGTQLVTQLNVLIKTSRIHGRINSALDKPVDAMLTLIKTLAHDQPVVLRLQNDFLFLGESHLKVNSQQLAVFTGVIDSLNAWKIGAISLSNSVDSKDLREFAHLFVSLDPETTSLEDLQKELKARNVQGIELEAPRELRLKDGASSKAGDKDAAEGKRQVKTTAKNGYARAAGAVGNLIQNAREGGTISFKQAKRAIQNIVDLMMQDESTLLGLTTLRCHDQYTHNHSVNVAILSIALGNRAGYPKVELADLGLAALFHDMGKSTIPMEVLNKPSEFTEEEWIAMRNHPTEGVLSLAKLRGITNLPGRTAAAAFEHHMNYDFSGYPKLTVPWKLSITGRILMIADCYDAMTSSRVYRREPLTPAKVLKLMFAKSGTSFDPTLLKLFVNCVGIVPIGSLVMLDSNELAVVLQPAQDKENAERPYVKVVADPAGEPIEDGPEYDLTEKNEAGEYTHSIVRLVDNAEYKFDTSRYFV
jgi:HD-GYP domain-containing protein (c-di-GMP phosphodiesterase class II)